MLNEFYANRFRNFMLRNFSGIISGSSLASDFAEMKGQTISPNDLQSPLESIVTIAIINAMSISSQNIGHRADGHVAGDGKLILSVSVWLPEMQPEVVAAVCVHQYSIVFLII